MAAGGFVESRFKFIPNKEDPLRTPVIAEEGEMIVDAMDRRTRDILIRFQQNIIDIKANRIDQDGSKGKTMDVYTAADMANGAMRDSVKDTKFTDMHHLLRFALYEIAKHNGVGVKTSEELELPRYRKEEFEAYFRRMIEDVKSLSTTPSTSTAATKAVTATSASRGSGRS